MSEGSNSCNVSFLLSSPCWVSLCTPKMESVSSCNAYLSYLNHVCWAVMCERGEVFYNDYISVFSVPVSQTCDFHKCFSSGGALSLLGRKAGSV